MLCCLALAACSKGGAECLDTPDCSEGMVCDLTELRCVAVDEARDLMSQEHDLRPSAPDFAEAPDLRPADLACRVEEGRTMCSGVCVDFWTSNDHCGMCNTPCVGKPEVKFTCCKGQCVGLTQDPNNCGGCGKACPGATHTCCSGVCKLGTSC